MPGSGPDWNQDQQVAARIRPVPRSAETHPPRLVALPPAETLADPFGRPPFHVEKSSAATMRGCSGPRGAPHSRTAHPRSSRAYEKISLNAWSWGRRTLPVGDAIAPIASVCRKSPRWGVRFGLRDGSPTGRQPSVRGRRDAASLTSSCALFLPRWHQFPLAIASMVWAIALLIANAVGLNRWPVCSFWFICDALGARPQSPSESAQSNSSCT